MISGVAVVPAAPALLPAVMGAAAAEVDAVRAASEQAVATVVSRLLDRLGRVNGRLVVVGGAPSGREAGSRSHDVAGELTDTSFGPNVHLAALPGARPPDVMLHGPAGEMPATVPTPLLVARSLCGAVAPNVPGADPVWAEALWVTITPEAAADYGRALARDDAPVALVLVADGAACHGPKAPRAEDARAVDYDDGVCEALRSGDPAAVAALDTGLGRQLSAEGAGLWPLLAAATRDPAGARDPAGVSRDWEAELLWRGAPYGVGWFVATWQRRR